MEATKQKKLALVLEDTEILAHLLSVLLRRLGFEVIAAIDGCDAQLKLDQLSARDRACIKIIISDVMMPNMCGPDFLKYVRAHEELARIPFVFCSAVDDPTQIRRAVDLKANGFIVKPATLEKVTSCLDRVFAKAPATP